MQGWGTWAGLGASPFLADIGPSRHEPGRLLATLILGLGVAFIAAMAGWMLVMTIATLLTGEGGEGFRGLGKMAAALSNLHVGGFNLEVLRLVVAAASDAIFWIAFVAVAAALARHDLKRYFTSALRVRWRLLAGGIVLGMLALGPVVAAERLLGPAGDALPVLAISHTTLGRLAYLAATSLLIPAAAAEELFFRGWLMRQFAAVTRRPWLLIGGSAIIFSALHLDFSTDGFVTRVLMGGGLAYMTLRLGGVEFAAGVHAANNLLIVLFLQPLLMSAAPPDAGFTVGSVLEDAILIAGYVATTEAVARTPALRRWLGVGDREISAGGAVPASLG